VAVLWALLLAGHAAAAAATLPARLHVPALVVGLGAGAFSFALAGVGARRVPGIRRAGLARMEAACGVAAVVAAGVALGAESDRAAWPLPVHPRPTRLRIEGKVADATTVDAMPASLLIEARRVTAGVHSGQSAVSSDWPSSSA